jgi:hypothetical protein
VNEARRLLVDRRHDGGVAVTDARDRDPAEKVEVLDTL